MKTIITGSRTLKSEKNIADIITILNNYKKLITEVVCPYELGVDRIGEAWANDNKITLMYFPTVNHRSGFSKNKDMARYADNALIFIEQSDLKPSNDLIKCLSSVKKEYKVFKIK